MEILFLKLSASFFIFLLLIFFLVSLDIRSKYEDVVAKTTVVLILLFTMASAISSLWNW